VALPTLGELPEYGRNKVLGQARWTKLQPLIAEQFFTEIGGWHETKIRYSVLIKTQTW
jgi:hypothetical protein